MFRHSPVMVEISPVPSNLVKTYPSYFQINIHVPLFPKPLRGLHLTLVWLGFLYVSYYRNFSLDTGFCDHQPMRGVGILFGTMYKKAIVKALKLKCSPSRFVEGRHS